MNCISVSRSVSHWQEGNHFAWVCRKKWDLDATVYNLLLSTVLMLQNARGALFIFSVPKKVVSEWDSYKEQSLLITISQMYNSSILTIQVKHLNNVMRSYNALLGWVYAPNKQMLSPRRQVNVCAFVIRQIKYKRIFSHVICSGWCVFTCQATRQNHKFNSLALSCCTTKPFAPKYI